MNPALRRAFSILAACFLLGIALFSLQAAPVTAGSLPAVERQGYPIGPGDPVGSGYPVFLPLIVKCENAISGRVTASGIGVPGISLTLEMTNWDEWIVVQRVTTAADGSYQFTCIEEPIDGFFYEIWYENGSLKSSQNQKDDRYLTFWVTQPFDSFPIGAVTGVNFDIADVVLKWPMGDTISLPATFTWNKRTTTTDHYLFNLFAEDDVVLDYYSNDLGYVGSFRLNGLPDAFSTGRYYGWMVWVMDSSGGYGPSFYYHYVIFSNYGKQSDQMTGQQQPQSFDRKQVREFSRERLSLP